MQVAARISRTLGVAAGAAVTAFGATAILGVRGVVAVPRVSEGPEALSPTTAFGITAAGIALLLLSGATAGPARRRTGTVLAALAAALGATGLLDALTPLPLTEAVNHLAVGAGGRPVPHAVAPAAALTLLLIGIGLALLDLDRLDPVTGRHRLRPAGALLLGAATIALVALAPRLVFLAIPKEPDPGVVMSPFAAAALTALAVGALLARPEHGPLGGDTGPGITIVRRLAPVLLALPFVAALASALAAYSGVSRPAAVISTGTIVAVLGLLGALALLVRSLEQADRRQRELLADRTRAEHSLAEHAAELEDSNAQLRDANTRLEAALTFKSDLTSMLTHDVAQPISSIASLAELLTSAWDDLDDTDRRDLSGKIDKNTRRLISMMNDLTLLFRLDTGSVTARRTPVPVREVVETAIDAVCPDGPDIAVDVPADLATLADRGHVWHIVQHLLRNAVTYGDTPVRVTGEARGERIVLIVADGGRGIPAELVPTLFDRFTRGTGMGLFIVRHLVEANGGTVRYESADPGARLVVTLETAAHTTATPAANAPARS